MSGHALLSASSAKRWLSCPPSARLTENLPDTESEYAAEGTVAHALGELMLRKHFTALAPSKYRSELAKIKKDPLYAQEMDAHIETYVDHVKQIALSYHSAPHVAIELKVDYSGYVPEGFGTADCVLIGNDTLHIVDLKYGKGVEVDCEQNPQLMLYALGAMLRYRVLYPIASVVLHVVQPRRDHIDTWQTTADELFLWAQSIQKTAQQAYEGKGDQNPGEWCRWCKIGATCRARADKNITQDFGLGDPPKPATLQNSEIGAYLTAASDLIDWYKALKDYALLACLAGREIPGYKAAEGRSPRQWTDQEKAFAAAQAAGIPEAILYKREPVTLAQLEKAVGKPVFTEHLAQFVTSPPGKPTLVEASDERPAINTIAKDFTKLGK